MVTTVLKKPLVTSIGTANKYYNSNSTASPSINTAYNIIAPTIKPISSPAVFYSQPANQTQIFAQIKQANTTVAKVGGLGSTTVIPTSVLKSSMDKLSTSGIKVNSPIIYPTPSAQGGRSSTYTPPPGATTPVVPDYDVKPIPEPKDVTFIDRTIIRTESTLDTVTNTVTNTVTDVWTVLSKAVPWIIGGAAIFLILSRGNKQ